MFYIKHSTALTMAFVDFRFVIFSAMHDNEFSLKLSFSNVPYSDEIRTDLLRIVQKRCETILNVVISERGRLLPCDWMFSLSSIHFANEVNDH